MLTLFFVLAGFQVSWGAEKISLDQYLAQVKDNYPSLAAARSRTKATEDRIAPSGAWDDPFFALGIDQIPTQGADMTSVWRYQVSQSIPFPGKKGAKKSAAEARALGSKADAESLERELTVIASQVFYRSHYIEAISIYNERLRKLLQNASASSKSRYQTGGSGHHEWLLARSELAVLEVEKLRLAREKTLLQARFNELRGFPPETEMGALLVEFMAASKIVPSKVQDQPELKAFDTAIAAASAEERTAKLAYFPDFVVQGMLMKPRAMPAEGTSAMSKNWGFMVGVNVPIYFFRKQANLVSAARFDSEAAAFERQGLENRLRAEVVDARAQLDSARSIVSLYKTSVIPTTKMAAADAKSGYSARKVPLSSLLEVLKIERKQELELLAAEIDVELAAVRMENLLSSPPLVRFAPGRPTLFQGMSDGMSEMPEATSMGKGTIGPAKPKSGPKESEAKGMGEM